VAAGVPAGFVDRRVEPERPGAESDPPVVGAPAGTEPDTESGDASTLADVVVVVGATFR
jgi:hypothetical protein